MTSEAVRDRLKSNPAQTRELARAGTGARGGGTGQPCGKQPEEVLMGSTEVTSEKTTARAPR
jgi:hypothetical protein